MARIRHSCRSRPMQGGRSGAALVSAPIRGLEMALPFACREGAVVLAPVKDAARRYAMPFGPP